MKETTEETEFYKPNINIDLAYQYFKKMLIAAIAKEVKPQRPMTKELKAKYRKLHLAHKKKRILRKSNFLPIGTVHLWQDGKLHRKTLDGWIEVTEEDIPTGTFNGEI